MRQRVFIVAQDQPGFWRHLVEDFADNDAVQVILDRRRGERRKRGEPHEPERRRGERRQSPTNAKDLRYPTLMIYHKERGQQVPVASLDP